MILSVTDQKSCRKNYLERIEKIAKVHPWGIILREKEMSPERYRCLARQVHKICQKQHTPLLVNSFWEIAREEGIPGIHLSFRDFREHKKELEDFSTKGVSVHSVSEGIEAEAIGADYLIAGHIFATDCKKGLPPRGIGFLRELCQAVSIPVFAIGGITPQTAGQLREAGAYGGAVMSGLMNCADVDEYIKQLRTSFEGGKMR